MIDNQQDPWSTIGNTPDQQEPDPTLQPIYLDPRERNPSTLPDGTPINTAMGDEPTPTDPTIPTDPGTDTGRAQRRVSNIPVNVHAGDPTAAQLQPGYTGPPDPNAVTNTGGGGGGGNSNNDALISLLTQMLAGQASDRANVAAQRQSLTDTLNRVIGEAEKPVSADDPAIAGPVSAFNAQGQRARRLMQEQLAQQAAASGQTTGSVDSAVKTSFDDLGNATGTYQGGLMTNELQSRRNQLQAALATGAGMLSAADMSRLQEELGLINSRIAAQGQNNQNTQFYDNLTSNMGANANSLDSILAAMIAQGGGSLAA